MGGGDRRPCSAPDLLPRRLTEYDKDRVRVRVVVILGIGFVMVEKLKH